MGINWDIKNEVIKKPGWFSRIFRFPSVPLCESDHYHKEHFEHPLDPPLNHYESHQSLWD